MKTTRYLPFIFLLLLVLSVIFSCGETAPTYEIKLLDSLNLRAYDYRYKNLDSSYQAALKAYRSAGLYGQGRAEACNNLGFCAFMDMDFDTAEKYYKEVQNITSNELERLIADIGLMKVYQRTSMNKEYFDYRNSALRRMKRINEEASILVDVHEINRWNYARTEFYIVSAIYYYYLQQRPEAMASMNEINVNQTLLSDTSQLLYYYYIKGSAGLCKGENLAERKINAFDYLFACWRLSRSTGLIYFEANSLQGISELLNENNVSDLLFKSRLRALQMLNEEQVADSILPLRLAQQALALFKQYDDVYQIAGTYRTIGTYMNKYGYYEDALDTLRKALDYVNAHHERYYHCTDTADRLRTYIPMDSVFTELSWINQDSIKSVPEWIARIREQLSVAYAGLGMKIPSDYNRNIYLYILDYTRQDKELENRYLSLEKESKQLNILILIVIIGLILLFILFWIFNVRSKVKNHLYTERLKLTLDVCQKITASIPVNAGNIQDIIQSLTVSILPDLVILFKAVYIRICVVDEEKEKEAEENVSNCFCQEFPLVIPDKVDPIGKIELYTKNRLTKDERALMNVITPYIAWTIDNGLTFISLGDERKRLEKKRYVYEQHIEENKRQNLIKKSCMAIVSGINPYIDRIINEVHKLTENKYTSDEQIRKDKYQYIDELVTKINEYNDILALWIKMKQGTLSLNIENFQLGELFEVLIKGRKTFEMRHQTFHVQPVDVIIKADKALTLFMINTLTENARKYTPDGGDIKVYAVEWDDYVEISVEDNGRGLTQQEISCILGEKVYDSKLIGIRQDSEDIQFVRSKGSGFGLMNCKGIIEKYRKTNDLFRVCSFNIESTSGKGSRFYFRLPKGIRKGLGILALIISFLFQVSCDNEKHQEIEYQSVEKEDIMESSSDSIYEELLIKASDFADTAYFCNVMENYSLALQYVDSAIHCLNEHYEKYAEHPDKLMSLSGEGMAAEIDWWNNRFDTDYHVILDFRNEAAVAFLALRQWDAYHYNNDAYTGLYKLLGKDYSLEDYCRRLQHSTNNKIVGIILCVILVLIILIGYYVLYIRRRYLNRYNLEQVLEINKQVFTASLIRMQDTDTILSIPLRIVDETFEAINELLIIDALGISVYDEQNHKSDIVFNPRIFDGQEEMTELMKYCLENKEYVSSSDSTIQCLLLLIDVSGIHRCVGVMAYMKRLETDQENDKLLSELIARYVAIVIFNAVVKLANQFRDIELAQDETRRASWEDSQLHVQNMVLDNCLSTIKHETIYYPNKIKQLLKPDKQGNVDIETISELVSYYKDIYTILSSCASRQLEEVTFKRGTIVVNELMEHAQKYMKKMLKKVSCCVELQTMESGLNITGDVIQLKYLLENLIDEALAYPMDGILKLEACQDDEYVRFSFIDTRREKSVEELNQLFYPDLTRMKADEGERLKGTEYLICKQIIRDHDEFAGRRGCRINAEPYQAGGFMVYFTIPAKQ